MYPRQDGMAEVSSTLFGGSHTPTKNAFSNHLGNHSLKCLFQVGSNQSSATMEFETMQK